MKYIHARLFSRLLVKAPILGHVGDGNFHAFIVVNMDDPLDYKKGRDLANRIAEYDSFTSVY